MRGFYFKFKIHSHVVVQLNRYFVFTGGLDRVFEMNLMTIDFVADLIFQSRHDILCRDRTEGFAGLASFRFKRHSQFIDPSRQLLRLIQLAGFTFGPFLFAPLRPLCQS